MNFFVNFSETQKQKDRALFAPPFCCVSRFAAIVRIQ